MRIEGFTEGKNLDDPGANEDQFLILPGRGYAVIDGVTDRTGERYDGMLAGRLAGLVVRDAAAAFLLDPAERACVPERLVAHITAAIQAAYAQHGIGEIARERPARRFGATLALAAHAGEVLRIILVGDSGVRFNGDELVTVDSGLDLVTAGIRQAAWQHLVAAGADHAECARVSRACVFNGLARLHPGMRPWLNEAALADLRQRYLAGAGQRFAHVPQDDIQLLVDGGIIEGQGLFQNNTKSPLSYCVLDGFPVPMDLVRVIDRPLTGLATLELFTDGYFSAGAEPTVAAWEAAFLEVERTDPDKLDVYPSVKGTVGRVRADDRTVLIVGF
ncbi:MAG: hypothetical protein H6852_16075 [Geminicoccaceae bacterium]|nr:hypothetical protein [Geminicoccaceae bacterium]MCB9969137.1 hypothetical protein [Geminicoccaceae bacterium]HRY23910.1 hypothetical protein [Geminicoccaceae bacterium]